MVDQELVFVHLDILLNDLGDEAGWITLPEMTPEIFRSYDKRHVWAREVIEMIRGDNNNAVNARNWAREVIEMIRGDRGDNNAINARN